MKNFLFVALAIVLIATKSTAQSCCQPRSMEDYQLLASSSEFKAAHAEPLPFVFESMEGGEMIKFAAGDTTANAFFIKAKNKSNKYLFVYQEWWGLNDHIKKEAEKYYTDLGGAVNVMAIELRASGQCRTLQSTAAHRCPQAGQSCRRSTTARNEASKTDRR